MELKPGYKQTEVGVIPEDWEMKPFKDSYSEPSRNGIYKPAEFHGRGTRIVNMGELFGIEFISDQDMNLVQLTSTESSVSELRDGDLLFGRRSVVPSGAGKCSLVISPSTPLTFESSIIRVRLNESRFWPLYGYYYFSSPSGESLVSTIVSGTNVKGVRASELGGLKIPWPPHAEQVQIAEALKGVDELLESLQQAIAKKRNIKQAAMQELLTGKRRLPGFEGEWDVKRLGDVAHIKTGSKNNEDKVEDGEYPFFVRSDNVERIGSYSYDCEAVLVPGEGRIGDIFHYIKGRFDVHQHVYAITQFTQEVSGKFVHCYLAMNFGAWAMQNTVKATVDSLRLPTFQTFEMRLPPTKEEQDSIAGVLTEIDAELATLEARKVKVQMLKQGMMQQFLTGKIRLK